MYTARVSEQIYPVSGGVQGSLVAGTYNGAWVSLRDYHRVFVMVGVGAMAAGATFDCALQQATNTAGAGAKAILAKNQVTAKAIVQLTQAGGDAYSLCCIELQTEELDVTNGFDCVRYQAVVAGGAVEAAVVIFVCESRFMPVPIANWAQIID